MLVDHGVKVTEAYLLQRGAVTTVSVHHNQISSEFFSQQDSAPAHSVLEAINFLTVGLTLPDIDQF